ncbi:MAG: Crp/Fnr family transcriptional regulator [Pseudomonadota bacterium]
MQNIKRGTILFSPGQECFGFVVLKKGSIKVILTSAGGREIVLYHVHPGEICLQTFGCLTTGTNYSAFGVAEQDLEVEIIAPSMFHQLLADNKEFRQSIFNSVAIRFSDFEKLVENVALSSVELRLARALMRLVDEKQFVEMTHEHLANEIGSAREVVSRQLGKFVKAGIIEMSRGQIKITDQKKLADICENELG